VAHLSDAFEDESHSGGSPPYPTCVCGSSCITERDVLLSALRQQNLAIRAAVLKALNRLRESNPWLNYSDSFVTEQIHQEARYYFELNAALSAFRQRVKAIQRRQPAGTHHRRTAPAYARALCFGCSGCAILQPKFIQRIWL
jgi:hypothetical protein